MAEIILHYQFASGQHLEICQGDITREKTDVIVNAANSHLIHGGGVAAAIARRGGEVIDRESREWVRINGHVTHAKPAVTSGGNLACKYVIHAVGPVWGDGDEGTKLNEAIIGSLTTAEGLKARSIAFPAISTGIYGFPVDRAAEIFMRTFKEYFSNHPKSITETVKIILFEDLTVNAFSKAYQNEFKDEALK
jgi:O-acetyl-ADP-ribose deacetylase (regulator of RNase III)